MLLEHYAGRLEYHDPWHRGREISHLFRGQIDAAEADRAAARARATGICGSSTTAACTASPTRSRSSGRGYHLIPAGGSKAAAVARHMRARGLRREQTVRRR